MDTHTPEQRSKNMSHIRSRNTSPELAVRRILHKMGYRYRLHKKDMAGKPDIYLKKYRLAVFIHGCFWHQHGCKRSVIPKSNIEYWTPKLEKNVSRFALHSEVLMKKGYNVFVVWECETKNVKTLEELLKKELARLKKMQAVSHI